MSPPEFNVKSAEEKLGEAVLSEALELAEIVAGEKDLPLGQLSQSYKNRYKWSEQCFLASAFREIHESYSSQYKKPHSFVTSFSTSDGSDATTADFFNKLHMAEGDSDFVNMSTYERSHMLWNLRLYKILYEEKDQRQFEFKKEIPLIFEKMAAEDMQHYKDKKTNMKFHHKDAAQYSQAYMGRPQTGYGLKSFEWRYVGSNPGTVRNDIEATMVVEFQSFDQLSKIRDFEGESYSLLDLLGYGPNSPKSKDPARKAEYESALFELKAVVQWDVFARSQTGLVPKDEKGKTLKDKVKGQKTTLFLTMIDHDFSISQLGTFTLTLTYRARLESLASQMNANVAYAPDMSAYESLTALDLRIEEENKLCPTNDEAILLDTMTREHLSREFRQSGHSNMLKVEFKSDFFEGIATKYASRKRQGDTVGATGDSRGFDDNQWRIYEVEVSIGRLSHFISLNPAAVTTANLLSLSVNGGIKPLKDATADEGGVFDTSDPNYLEREINIGSGYKEDYRTLRFMFFGDILEVMANRGLWWSDNGKSGKTDEKIKIISGPLRLKVRGQEEIRCSISDIPISLDVFSDFWYRNVVEPNRETYSLVEFIRDFGEQVINKAFGEDCLPGMSAGVAGVTRLKTSFFSLPQYKDGSDPLLHLKTAAGKSGVYNSTTGDILVENMPILTDPKTLSETSPNKVYDYIVLYLQNTDVMKWSGKEDEDKKKGIYHLKIHQGILQSIDFSKTDQPYLREARFKKFNKNPLVHLSNVYNVRASMVGNTCFYPGDTVYINPIGFGTSLGSPMAAKSLSSVMGLGGYHTIISVTNRISRDFTTEINAQWTSNGSGNAGSDYSNEGCNEVEDPDD